MRGPVVGVFLGCLRTPVHSLGLLVLLSHTHTESAYLVNVGHTGTQQSYLRGPWGPMMEQCETLLHTLNTYTCIHLQSLVPDF